MPGPYRAPTPALLLWLLRIWRCWPCMCCGVSWVAAAAVGSFAWCMHLAGGGAKISKNQKLPRLTYVAHLRLTASLKPESDKSDGSESVTAMIKILVAPSDTVESPPAISLSIYDFERGQTNEEEEKQGGWINKDKEMR